MLPRAGSVTTAGWSDLTAKVGGSGGSRHDRGIFTKLSTAAFAVVFEQLGEGLRVHSGLPSKRLSPPSLVTGSTGPVALELRMKISPAPNAPSTNAILVPSGNQAHSYSSLPA